MVVLFILFLFILFLFYCYFPVIRKENLASDANNNVSQDRQGTSQQVDPSVDVKWDFSQTKYVSINYKTTLDGTEELNTGIAKAKKADWSGAIKDYTSAINLNPNFAEAYYHRSFARSKLGLEKRAQEDYQKAILLNPNIEASLSKERMEQINSRSYKLWQKAQEQQSRVLQSRQQGTEALEKFYQKVSELQDTESYVVMEAPFLNKRMKPINYNSYEQFQAEAEELYATGNLFATLGNFQEALKSYDQAIALNKSNPMYFNNRASTLKRLGRMQEALAQYNELVKLHPSYGKAYLSTASAYIEINAYSEAVNSYKKFLSAFNLGQFCFNPIVGGVSQTIKGASELETILYTSINYLMPEQQKIAVQAFNEAIEQL